MFQRMSPWWSPCAPQSVHAQQPDPLRHCVQGEHQQVSSHGGEHLCGKLSNGNSVWHRVSTVLNFSICLINHPFIHVHPGDLLQSEVDDLCRKGQEHHHHCCQIKNKEQNPEAIHHRGRPQPWFRVLIPSPSQMEVVDKDHDLATYRQDLHTAGRRQPSILPHWDWAQ